MLTSFFWIGWTAKPTVNWAVPVVGTGVFVWGNLSVLVRGSLRLLHTHESIANLLQISLIPYIFDAFPPIGTLGALTAGASGRILIGGLIPMVIFDFTNLGGDWALSIFGFVTIPLMAIPFILFFFGPALRSRSRFSEMSAEESQMLMLMNNKEMRQSGQSGQA